MPNTSATGGPLVPISPGPKPLEDDELEQFLQQWVVGITGLPGDMVRPRWQEEPPNMPPLGTDWASVGTTQHETDTNAVVIHHGDGEGYDELQRHETMTLLCSFYGPNAEAYAGLLRDGLGIAQNREPLYRAGMGFVRFSRTIRVPMLIKQTWWPRSDISVELRRAIVRTYPVLNILHGVTKIKTETVGDVSADTQ